MMNWLKKVNVIQTINSSDLVKKIVYSTKCNEIEKKILDHGKYITTQEFNKFTSENYCKIKTSKFIKQK